MLDGLTMHDKQIPPRDLSSQCVNPLSLGAVVRLRANTAQRDHHEQTDRRHQPVPFSITHISRPSSARYPHTLRRGTNRWTRLHRSPRAEVKHAPGQAAGPASGRLTVSWLMS
jgi:hypothetical protein